MMPANHRRQRLGQRPAGREPATQLGMVKSERVVFRVLEDAPSLALAKTDVSFAGSDLGK